MEFNLHNLRMNAVETDENGVIDERTIFEFRQEGRSVHAEYSGGRIERGFLVGVIAGSSFEFRYCQLEAGGVLNGGESKCELRITEDSKVQIVEHFEWASRPGGGRNVIQEVE